MSFAHHLSVPVPEPETSALEDYESWLDRLGMTYESVAVCCWHRLHDRDAAHGAAMRVVAGLIDRPRVFGFWGLPYSGRIAHLAEAAIVDFRANDAVACGTTWLQLRAALASLTRDDQQVFVLACVESLDDAELAAELQCDQRASSVRRAQAISHLRELCARSLA